MSAHAVRIVFSKQHRQEAIVALAQQRHAEHYRWQCGAMMSNGSVAVEEARFDLYQEIAGSR